jgi:ABC-type polysaccharide/polyol phosphate transport system ATPase subunit
MNPIQFNRVSKKFKKGKKLLLKEALLDMFKPEKTEVFWVLRDISFNVRKGETLGIIGTNGSGKSTILKLIAGVMDPDEGRVTTFGRIAPLIELGAGFHPELSGRENIFLNGSILGLRRGEIEKQYNNIVDFAGLEDFIDTPVKHYSSGMYMRLGFSIAVHTDPEILLVDEILAVGDTAFQEKCLKKMEEFKKTGVTIVFVGHNLAVVKKFCDRVIYLEDAQVKGDGEPGGIIEMYKKSQKISL